MHTTTIEISKAKEGNAIMAPHHVGESANDYAPTAGELVKDETHEKPPQPVGVPPASNAETMSADHSQYTPSEGVGEPGQLPCRPSKHTATMEATRDDAESSVNSKDAATKETGEQASSVLPQQAGVCPDQGQPEVMEVFAYTHGSVPAKMQVPVGHTAGQLLTAHAKLAQIDVTNWQICTAMGTPVPLSSQITPGKIYRLDQIGTSKPIPCQSHLQGFHKQIPQLAQNTREILLWQQLGWVAVDEMKFYMEMAANSYPGVFQSPLVIGNSVSMGEKNHAALVKHLLDMEFFPLNPQDQFLPQSCMKHIGFPSQPCQWKEQSKLWCHHPGWNGFELSLNSMLDEMKLRLNPSPFRLTSQLIAVSKQLDGSCPNLVGINMHICPGQSSCPLKTAFPNTFASFRYQSTSDHATIIGRRNANHSRSIDQTVDRTWSSTQSTP